MCTRNGRGCKQRHRRQPGHNPSPLRKEIQSQANRCSPLDLEDNVLQWESVWVRRRVHFFLLVTWRRLGSYQGSGLRKQLRKKLVVSYPLARTVRHVSHIDCDTRGHHKSSLCGSSLRCSREARLVISCTQCPAFLFRSNGLAQNNLCPTQTDKQTIERAKRQTGKETNQMNKQGDEPVQAGCRRLGACDSQITKTPICSFHPCVII